MKQKPTITIAFLLTIIFELTLMIMVYQKIGADRLPTQIIRLVVQVTLFLILFEKPSKTLLYILTFYHVLVALPLIPKFLNLDITGQLVLGYHVLLTVLIFFHVNIDQQFFLQYKNRNSSLRTKN